MGSSDEILVRYGFHKTEKWGTWASTSRYQRVACPVELLTSDMPYGAGIAFFNGQCG